MAAHTATATDETIVFRAEDLVDRVPDPGWYRTSITGAWKRPTATGSVAVKVKFEITEDGDFEGAEVWDQFVVEAKDQSDGTEEGEAVARRRLARLFRACGGQVKAETTYKVKDLEGRDLVVMVVPDRFEGQPRARIKAFRPVAGKSESPVRESKEEADTPF